MNENTAYVFYESDSSPCGRNKRNDFQSSRPQVKSSPVKSALVKSSPSQISLKMKVKSAPKKKKNVLI